MKSSASRTRAALVAVAVSGLLLAGCTTPGTDPGTGSTGDFTADEIATGLEYSGGAEGAADDSLDPVKIGFINVEGGIPSFPEATAAAQATVSLVNDHLGGVDGHPVELVTCNIVAGDEDALKCAQQFANDPEVLSIALGMTVFGTGPIYSTIGDSKAMLGSGPFNPIDLTPENTAFYAAAAYANGPAVLLYAKEFLDASSMAVLYDSTDPGATAQAQVIEALAGGVDVDVKVVPASNASEWSSALVSAGGQTADVIMLVASSPACAPFAQAAQQLAITAPVMAFGFCQDQAVADALGDFPLWTYFNPTKSPLGGSTPDAELFASAMEFYAPGVSVGGGSATSFQIVFALVQAMNGLGYDNLTVEGINEAVQGNTGPAFMGPPALDCGFLAEFDAPTLCTTTSFAMEYLGDGEWNDPTDGQGIDTGDLSFTAISG
jgi:branched-chain amino acid transport system substrate-binding protein